MNERIVRVQGAAKVRATPDEVRLEFTVKSKDHEYAVSVRKLDELVEGLRQDLEHIGEPRTTLKTTSFRVDTIFRDVKTERVFEGYQAVHDLRLTLPIDRDRLNRVLQAVAKGASHAVFTIDFGLKDDSLLRQQALAEAVAAAKQNAETLAKAAGASLGQLLRIDYGWAELRVSESFSCKGEYSIAESMMEPEEVVLQDSVTMVWELN